MLIATASLSLDPPPALSDHFLAVQGGAAGPAGRRWRR